MALLKVLLVSIFTIGSLYCAGQSESEIRQLRKEIIALTDSIANDTIEGRKVANFCFEEQYKRYERFQAAATDQELIILTDHKDVLVRCDAFNVLARRKNANIFSVLLKHINDTAGIDIQQGCLQSHQSVGDYFLYVVSSDNSDSNSYKLSVQQQSIIDSILLFDKTIRISTKYALLFNVKPNRKYYERIRKIAIEEKSPEAVLALSKFKNKRDTGLIKKLFSQERTEYFGIRSAKEFPDNSFYLLLKRTFEKEWKDKYYDYSKWEILFQALAKYPSKPTYQLFERVALSKDEFRYQTLGQYVLIAINKYPNMIFDPLKSKIKLDESHQIDLEEILNED